MTLFSARLPRMMKRRRRSASVATMIQSANDGDDDERERAPSQASTAAHSLAVVGSGEDERINVLAILPCLSLVVSPYRNPIFLLNHPLARTMVVMIMACHLR